jgi:hypothetical protein
MPVIRGQKVSQQQYDRRQQLTQGEFNRAQQERDKRAHTLCVRIPDDKPRYVTGANAHEVVEKLSVNTLMMADCSGPTDYMQQMSEHSRASRPDAPFIRWDSPDHFLLDAAAAGLFPIVPFDEALEPGAVY